METCTPFLENIDPFTESLIKEQFFLARKRILRRTCGSLSLSSPDFLPSLFLE